MLDSFANGAGGDTDCDPAPQPAVLVTNGHAANDNTTAHTHREPPTGDGIQRTTALDDIRRHGTDLAALLELDPEFLPSFIFRLTCIEAGRRALQHRGANIEAVRAACADRIQSAVAAGGAHNALAGAKTTDLIARATEIAQARPDPGSRMANVGDVVAAVYEKADADRGLGELMQGRRLPSVAEQVTAETERIGAILRDAVQDRIDQAEKAIVKAVTPPQAGGLTPVRLAAGIAILCAVAGLAIYWAGGFPQLHHTITALGLLPA